jgi:putative addiction module killer protein
VSLTSYITGVLVSPKEIVVFRAKDGGVPFEDWLDDLEDKRAVARLLARLARVRQGNLGDCKPVGGGVSELRVDYGPGYPCILGSRGRHWWCCFAAEPSERKIATSVWQSNIGGNLKRAHHEARKL